MALFPVNPVQFLSHGIVAVGGLPPVFEFVERIPKRYTIIEIGSGNGVLLKILESQFPDRKFIGIDPLNYDYMEKGTPEYLKRSPDYSSVEELLSKFPELVKNCALLINWPEPQNYVMEFKLSESYKGLKYDLLSIKSIKPKYILTCFDVSGSSGSNAFVDFMLPMIKSELPENLHIFGRIPNAPVKIGIRYKKIKLISVTGVDNTPFKCPVYDTLALFVSIKLKKKKKKSDSSKITEE